GLPAVAERGGLAVPDDAAGAADVVDLEEGDCPARAGPSSQHGDSARRGDDSALMPQTTTQIAPEHVPSPPPVCVRPASVWLLTNAPSPYQAELFTHIARRADIDLSVRLMRAASSSGQSVACDFGGLVMRAVAPAR